MKWVHKKVNAFEGEHFKTVTETSLDCQLCSVSVMRNEPQIRAHLTKSHNMTMEEYAARDELYKNRSSRKTDSQ